MFANKIVEETAIGTILVSNFLDLEADNKRRYILKLVFVSKSA